ncbi:hypothetical protein PHIM7_247 [Sinorhizobium phage phiM7]|uniref:Uncharacterized protein n=3 Tax=Emdodecavirus TaxID=1980937 RepID=S5MBH4_9CAUD|nr:hypothetical protein AB690_gp260 [Sinorhizobium phage phiM12]YP_009212493.1 hypothetical protein AVT40_gp280 [Sinorhizobium phage phiN3]YP_009601372.1 hypothetical protein FDH46_gp231 [Sinorhizobium phage phiM7]AKF13153.1 hypothetical protein PHIM19_248 [Sinorhizobium phage phiM19]AGR47963.1 hypothetical protein SmphiM12_331 [Sinorhizobium phage phiM12]AKF12792.1 hypothetical protein PHIM7_247 [Sinorhizobium phage phiM7]AKF13516.1 hypothetical protein PHIN3_253 [Sinorhizobium phage phiN3]
MVRIDSEWDFGYGDTVFRTEAEARQRLKEDENVQDVAEEYETTVEGLISQGLISFQTVLLG